MKRWVAIVGSFALLTLGHQTSPTHAASLEGAKTVSLVTPAGDKVAIGKLDLKPTEGGYAFALTFKRDVFQERYMRENNVLCLEAAGKEVCHFTYPPAEYASDDASGVITDNDLRSLEYALLFVEKRPAPAEVDIDPFNGLYYKLKTVDGHIEGTVYGVDLTSTYTDGGVGKYIIERLDDLDLASQRFPRLVIQ